MADAERLIASLTQHGVDLDAITEQLEQEGVEAFKISFRQLLLAIQHKLAAVDGSPS